MAFTATFLNGPYRIEGGRFAAESWTFTNGAADSGGAITARNLKRIVRVDGAGFVNSSVSGLAVTLECDPDSDGSLEIIGELN